MIIIEGVFNTSDKKRKPNHPGKILEELYIKPLDLNLQELADNLGKSRNILFRIRTGKASITPAIAIRLAEAFNTSPHLWLNLQQNYDIWVEKNEKKYKPVKSLYYSQRALKSPRRRCKAVINSH